MIKEIEYELVPCTCPCHDPENVDENGNPTIIHFIPCCHNGLMVVPKQNRDNEDNIRL